MVEEKASIGCNKTLKFELNSVRVELEKSEQSIIGWDDFLRRMLEKFTNEPRE